MMYGVDGLHFPAAPKGVGSSSKLAVVLNLGVHQLDADVLRESLEEKLLEKRAGWVFTEETQHFIHESRGFGVS